MHLTLKCTKAFNIGKGDKYIMITWNVTYVDSHDYASINGDEKDMQGPMLGLKI